MLLYKRLCLSVCWSVGLLVTNNLQLTLFHWVIWPLLRTNYVDLNINAQFNSSPPPPPKSRTRFVGGSVCLYVWCLYVCNILTSPPLPPSPPLQQRDKETKRQRDKETKRQRDKEIKKQRDKNDKKWQKWQKLQKLQKCQKMTKSD